MVFIEVVHCLEIDKYFECRECFSLQPILRTTSNNKNLILICFEMSWMEAMESGRNKFHAAINQQTKWIKYKFVKVHKYFVIFLLIYYSGVLNNKSLHGAAIFNYCFKSVTKSKLFKLV